MWFWVLVRFAENLGASVAMMGMRWQMAHAVWQ
jgi:hypothetical protein